jgi:hypothetical protein
MLADALKFLRDLGNEAARPVKLDVPDPRQVHYLFNGADHGFDLPVPPRQHAVATLDDLIALARRFAEAIPEDEADARRWSSTPVVWYGPDRVVLVIDDAGHRVERATFQLEHSDVFKKIQHLQKQELLVHRAFCRLLRIDLKTAIPAGELLDKVKAIEFQNGSIVKASSARGAESIGKSIKNEVADVGKIPEEVTLFARVYCNPLETFEAGVRCAVDIEPDHNALRLVPLPDAVEEAVELAVAWIGRRLVEALGEDVPCYCGAP